MALKDGDVVRFDYTLYVDGKMLETSEEAVARANGIHRESRRYQPLTVTLGSRQIIPGLESHMRSHGQMGQTVTVDIAPAGERGTSTPVAGGRVRVDLNHDLAGKALRYEYTIRDVVADEAGKVSAV